MSRLLLEALASDLGVKGLMNGFVPKYHRWSDTDMKGQANFVLFRMAGTGGIRNSVVQSPDVRILVVAYPDTLTSADDMANDIYRYFASIDKPDYVVKLEPVGGVMGPYNADNGRVIYELVVRCFIEGY